MLVTMAGFGAFILMGMTMSPSDVSNETFVVQLKCTFFFTNGNYSCTKWISEIFTWKASFSIGKLAGIV